MPDAGLVIPIRYDMDPALKKLHELQAANKAAGAAGKKAGKEAQESYQGMGGAIARATDDVANLMKAQIGLQTARQVVHAISDEFKRAADFTRDMAKDFIALQKTMQSVAAITGNQNSNKFTVAEARAGAAANLTPAEWTQFRDAFMAKASNYVGKKPNAILNDAEAGKFQASMAEYAKLHGVGSGEMADFAGGLLRKSKGRATRRPWCAKAGKVFATLEASSKKVGGLLPGMTRIMAQGLGAEEAAPKLAMMPEIAPDEESTHLLRVINEIRQLDQSGKGGNFGIEKGMTMNEKLEAVVTNLEQRSTRGGKIDQEQLDKLLAEVTPESIAQNTLRGLANKGQKAMGQWKDILVGTSATAVQEDIALGRQTDAGRQMHAEAQNALVKTERGSDFAPAETALLEAQTDLIRSRKMEQFHPAETLLRGTLGALTGVSSDQSIINEQALKNVRREQRRPG